MYLGEKLIKREPFRWGIVGGGKTSQVGYKHRLGAMRDNTSFLLTAATFDVDAERGREFGVSLGMDADRCYPDYKTMFEAEAKREDGIEVVDVATPNFLHYEVTKAALEAGLHVICEKPLFFEVEQGEEIKKLAEESASSAVETRDMLGNNVAQITIGNDTAVQTSQYMNNMIEELDHVVLEVAKIRTVSDGQAETIQQISQAVEQINGVVQSNSAASEEVSATSEELSASAQSLNGLLASFKLRN